MPPWPACVAQVLVILTWAGLLAGSLFAFNYMKIGLEQQLVLPTGSYLKTYFDQQAELGEAGPPVYIVLQNVNYTHPDVSGRMRGVAHPPPPTPSPPPLSRPHCRPSSWVPSSHRPCRTGGLFVHPLPRPSPPPSPIVCRGTDHERHSEDHQYPGCLPCD